MSKYYKTIVNHSKLKISTGTKVIPPPKFAELSSLIISRCSFLQSLIQRVIYATHGSELLAAKRALTDSPSPEARMELLSTLPYTEEDPVISSVFKFARGIFRDIYKLRNVLAHENWGTSEEFKNVVLFSSLDKEAKLSFASGHLLHNHSITPEELYKATVRYIESVKLVSVDDLENARGDAELCSWILMLIDQMLNEPEPQKKDAIREAFLIFPKTSHLFEGVALPSKSVHIQTTRTQSIRG